MKIRNSILNFIKSHYNSICEPILIGRGLKIWFNLDIFLNYVFQLKTYNEISKKKRKQEVLCQRMQTTEIDQILSILSTQDVPQEMIINNIIVIYLVTFCVKS